MQAMEQFKPTATLILDRRNKKKSGKYPIKLTVYYQKSKMRFKTNVDLTNEEWQKLRAAKLKDEKLKVKRIELNAIVSEAQRVIDSLSHFTFVEFEKAFFNRENEEKTVSLVQCFKDKMNALTEAGRIGTASTYRTALNSILSFHPSTDFSDVTASFLEEYERAMVKKGRSLTSIGIYMRHLRAVFNQAIDDGYVSRNVYPFKKYQIPSSRNIKKALNDEQLTKLLNHKPSTSAQQKALDFWIFSYLCNGMNIIDIMLLKGENIKGKFLYYIRAKTKNTKKKDLRPIEVPLHDTARQIINKYRTGIKDEEYVFPILQPGLSPLTIKHRSKRFLKLINSNMELIRQDLGIEQKIGTYAARHSFSTRLKKRGAPTEFIKESLGHSSVLVTENYLDSFEDETKLKYSALLTD
jgi:integrase